MRSRRGFLISLASLPIGLNATVLPTEPIASIEKQIFNAINFQRVSDVAEPLIWSDALASTSRAHSARMLEGHFFGHEDPLYGNLAARLTRTRIDYWLSAENVFREKNYDDPVPIAIVEWMYSEGHRHHLLNAEYKYTGVGAAIDSEGTVTITQEFLTPRPRRS